MLYLTSRKSNLTAQATTQVRSGYCLDRLDMLQALSSDFILNFAPIQTPATHPIVTIQVLNKAPLHRCMQQPNTF
jgi:hypothetical protein